MDSTIRQLRDRAETVLPADRRRLLRRIAGAEEIVSLHRQREIVATLTADVASAERLARDRRALTPATLTYPEELPITDRREELLSTIRDNQVVIVAGETGSGKSTQLPKLCLELGRGIERWIGHTQPRRIAARSIAARVAEELGSMIGGLVGYTVRFSDQVGDKTLVKVMTDGILLAEVHRDRRLNRYDTIILDEAHERSLNIDFLLGYLKNLMPRRRDLKLIVTSATIDTERFSSHFGDAPVVEVSGRTYPVEIRYRPLDDPTAAEPRDQPQGISDAVSELAAEGSGDILVFCSGEREIRDAADALAELGLRHTEIMPLYARLSTAEQQRVFQPHRGRRIVLATNVAETSLTVPGIRYVVDAGTARISRYSRRTKVQQLPIESISRASADQRAGRCGRLGPGICTRLYDRDDYDARPEFTDPEIQRTNLASVILQMAALDLGDVETFPFLDPPDARTVRDGVALLHELGAVDPAHEGSRRWMTAEGRRLAQIPLDLRLAKMLLEAGRNGCVREVKIIAAALAIQDPRERPKDHEPHADQLHARFTAESDFLTWLKLWSYLHEERRARSSSGFRRLCREEYLNYRRVREWQDIHAQLGEVAAELGLVANRTPAEADVIHVTLLAGLVSHVGSKDPDGYQYRGVRGSRFWISPGSALFKRSPEWVMAAELVETSRLWGRGVARIEPEWVERVGAHLVSRSHSDPWWDVDRGAAVAQESVTLFGLPLVNDRTVMFGRVDMMAARELLIRHALVAGEWETHHAFATRNAERIRAVLAIETRERRTDLLADDAAVVAFFDRRLPGDITSVRHFDRWWRDMQEVDPHLLDLDETDLIDPGALPPDTAAFPEEWRHGDLAIELEYEFDPASRADGVTIDIPAEGLDKLDPAIFSWNVPGLRSELIDALVRSLPKQLRRRFVPIAETVDALTTTMSPEDGELIHVLRASLSEMGGVSIPPDAFDLDTVPAHLRPRFRIVERTGLVLAEGDNLAAIKAELAEEVRAVITQAGHPLETSGLTSWTVGTLQQEVMIGDSAHQVAAYPALVDEFETVAVRLLATEEEQADAMWAGTRRLLLLSLPSPERLLRPLVNDGAGRWFATSPYETASDWIEDCLGCAVDGIVAHSGGPAWDGVTFDALLSRVRDELADEASKVGEQSLAALAKLASVSAAVTRLEGGPFADSLTDVVEHVRRLVYPEFLTAIGADRVPDVARYLEAVERRLEALPDRPDHDVELMMRARRLEARYERLVALVPMTPGLLDLGWMLEELRVSLFAQSLGTKGKVSEKRIERALTAASG